MAGLLAAQIVAMPAHFFHHITITDIGFDNFTASLPHCYVQPHVAHDCRHQGLLFEEFALQHVAGADGHNMVAIDLVAEFVTDDDPVSVSIQSNTDIGAVLFYSFTDHGWIGRTAAGIDIGSVRLDSQRYYLCPQFFKNRRSDLVGGAVCTVQHNLETGEIHLHRKGIFEENNVATGSIVDAEGLENCRKALEKGKGVLLFGAHFGNWELEAVAASLLLAPLAVIYRHLDSPFLDRLVLKVRSATGNIPLAKEHAMRAMLRTLNTNGMLGILIDQNVDWYEGVFVDYFGRPACTTNGLAILALHTGTPVLPGYMARLPNGRYRFVIGPEVEIVDTGDRDADVLANTQRFTKIIEETVRLYPDQWLWVHKRWKTQLCQIRRKE